MSVLDTLLLVSGSAENRRVLRLTFEETYNLLEADTLAQAMMFLEQNRNCIAAVILDVSGDGKMNLSLLREMRKNSLLKKLPVVVMTESGDPTGMGLALGLGATEAMPADEDPYILQRRVQNIVELTRHKRELEEMVSEQNEILRHANDAMVDALSSVIEYRSAESGQHILRIRRFTQILLQEIQRSSRRYNLTEELIRIISSAAALHDIGKISIPDAILNKPGTLTEGEWEIMKGHSRTGARIIESLSDVVDPEYRRYAYEISHHHHERWDGSGYPDGLVGDQIPICAQVVGLADAYDALTTQRVYREAISSETAANMIISGECGAFSPMLLECFKNVAGKFADVTRAYADGLSPRAERFDTMLPLPIPQEGPSALQVMTSKYQMLLHYLDAAVMEVDLDLYVYHVIYNPDPNLNQINSTNSLLGLINIIAGQIRDPAEKAEFYQFVEEKVPKFWNEGLMRMQYHLNLYDRFSREPERYCVTLLRQSVTNRDMNKLIILCDRVAEDSLEESGTRDKRWAERIPASLSPVHCSYRNDRDLTLVSIDERALRSMKYTRETFKAQIQGKIMNLVHPEDRERVRLQTARQLAMGKRLELECRMVCGDGSSMWILNRCRLEVDAEGQEIFRGFILEIDHTKRERDALQAQLDRQKIILAQTENVLFEWDVVNDDISFSDSWEGIFGYPSIRGSMEAYLNEGSRFHPEDILTIRDALEIMRTETDYHVMEIRIARADGRYIWCRARCSAQRNEQGRLIKVVGILINVDEEKRSTQALKAQAEQDVLTKLLNSGAARKRAEDYLSSFARNASGALFIIDLDDFKQVNDRYGHLFGDAALSRAAREIQRLFRSQDIVARIGGDEFMVLMLGVVDRQLVERRCGQLIDAFHNLFADQAERGLMSCSVGVSLFPEHGRSYSELFRRADQALYYAKSKGKDSFAIYDSGESYHYGTLAEASARTQIDSDDRRNIATGGIAEYAFRNLYESGDTEQTIREILAAVGQEAEVSRVYIFENNPDGSTCSNTFEWCDGETASQKEFMQNIRYAQDIPSLKGQFDENGIFYCADIGVLPRDLHHILGRQGIKSLLLCAIQEKGEFRGFIGFDECKMNRLWTREYVEVLRKLTDIISVFLMKHRIEQRIQN